MTPRQKDVERKLPPRIAEQLADFKIYLQMELGRGKNTVYSYATDALQFAVFAAEHGAKSFAEIDGGTIVEWIGEIHNGTKSTTQSRKLSAMKSLATHLVDEGVWDKNYSDLVARPKIRRNVPEVLDAAEIDDLIAAPQNGTPEAARDRAMLELMYGSGLRVSELCNLKESDIDAKMRIIRVRGKGEKTRLVPIGDYALDAIDAYRKVRKELAKKSSPAELFITRRGKKISRKTFWYNIKKYAAAANIEKNVKPHILRHSFATHLLRNGANLMAIREMLGHSDLGTTQIYTRLVNDDIYREYNAKHPRNKMDVETPNI